MALCPSALGKCSHVNQWQGFILHTYFHHCNRQVSDATFHSFYQKEAQLSYDTEDQITGLTFGRDFLNPENEKKKQEVMSNPPVNQKKKTCIIHSAAS